MSWNPFDHPVDYIILAGQRSPGIAEIHGASSPRQWDKRKGYALSGASLVYKGIDLAEFSVQLRLYTPEDFAAWDTWSLLVKRAPNQRRPGAMDISHPLLEQLEIRSVVVENVLQPVQTDDGEWTVEIKFLEYRQPTVALARPQGSVERPDQWDLRTAELTVQLAREIQLADPSAANTAGYIDALASRAMLNALASGE